MISHSILCILSHALFILKRTIVFMLRISENLYYSPPKFQTSKISGGTLCELTLELHFENCKIQEYGDPSEQLYKLGVKIIAPFFKWLYSKDNSIFCNYLF